MSLQNQTGNTHKPRVLLVDDSRVIRRAVSKILSEQFQLIETEDGEQGWLALASDPEIEVVITDVEMPRLDGHGLLARIRGADTAAIREIPVIVITGADDEPAREKAYAHGATDFIIKPIDSVQLLARVHAQVRFDQATRKLAAATRLAEEQAMYDTLTQLPSRRYFLQRAVQDLSFARRHGAGLALLRLDIEGTIFLSQRAQDGNQRAVSLGRLLLASVRQEDTVAYFGASDFAVLLPTTTYPEAVAFATRLCREVESQAPKAVGIALSVSAGVASLDDGDDLESLLAIAEKRLQLTKKGAANMVNGSEQRPARPKFDASPNPIDIDTALRLIASGEHDKLDAQLGPLTHRALPLLELCNRRLGLGLGFAIESLKEKLSRFTP